MAKTVDELYWRLNRIAYPSFDCEDCIGAGCGREWPCWCEHMECEAPGVPAKPWRVRMRRWLRKWYRAPDLSDILTNIEPTETPFLRSCNKSAST